jgi:ribosomal-protein-alanine N-acetyltransferase
MASPPQADAIAVARGSVDQIERVMEIMEGAFGNRFGEAWTHSQLRGILPMSGVFLALAVDMTNAGTIGFSLSRTVADEAELLLIAVDPGHYRQGVGKLLLDDFLARSEEQKVSRVHLEVRDGNPAIAMYNAAGFSAVGRRRNYYHSPNGDSFDAITLSRDL